MDGMASLALITLGLRLEATFRPPWQARSVSAFWGAHWNLAASNAVRCSVYEPILEGCWRKLGRKPHGPRRQPHGKGSGRPPRAALALCTACLTSGLVHEVIVWYITGTSVWGAWLAFFALQVGSAACANILAWNSRSCLLLLSLLMLIASWSAC
jgi:hypothetical protein